MGRATPKRRNCQSNGRSCRTLVPASPAEPEHFYRVTMEPEQFADGSRPAARTLADARHAPGRRAAVAASAGAALSHWHLAWRSPQARSPAWCVQERGACSSSGRHPQGEDLQTEYTERDDGSVAETRILTDKFVPVIRMGHDAWFPDTGR